MRTAQGLAKYGVNAILACIWKPRTRPGSFEGIRDVLEEYEAQIRLCSIHLERPGGGPQSSHPVSYY